MSRGTARFSCDGNASANRGYIVPDVNTPVSMRLEDAGTDITKVQFSLVRTSKSAGGDPPAFTPSDGIAVPASGIVQIQGTDVSPAPQAWMVRCVANNGQLPDGSPFADYTFDRLLVVPTTLTRLRATVALETVEYDPVYGWAAVLEQIATAFESERTGLGSSFSSGTPVLTGFNVANITTISGTVSAVTLPQASTWGSDWLGIQKSNIAGAVTINAHAGDTINGAATYSLTGAYGGVLFRSYGGTVVLTAVK
jgi:hypothetical protein